MTSQEDSPLFFLVEDNSMDIELTRRAFSRYEPAPRFLVARDGEEAIGLVRSLEMGATIPELVLLDLKLPRLGGHEVLVAIRQSSAFTNVPVIILTTSDEEKDIAAALHNGANLYMIKPVAFDDFILAAGEIHRTWQRLKSNREQP
jgi:hypothetical protein